MTDTTRDRLHGYGETPQVRREARATHGVAGRLDVDPDARVVGIPEGQEEAPAGWWVAAWVWVPADQLPELEPLDGVGSDAARKRGPQVVR
jgi:hypothetical protein